jgi:hypothetical protein
MPEIYEEKKTMKFHIKVIRNKTFDQGSSQVKYSSILKAQVMVHIMQHA